MERVAVPDATILVVEDDSDLRESLADSLRDAGYVVMTAADGAGALSLLGKIVADLIVVDGAMPQMTGLEFIEAWRQDPRSGAPVVLATGSGAIVTPPVGCAALVTKPFTIEQLLDVIHRLIGAPHPAAR